MWRTHSSPSLCNKYIVSFAHRYLFWSGGRRVYGPLDVGRVNPDQSRHLDQPAEQLGGSLAVLLHPGEVGSVEIGGGSTSHGFRTSSTAKPTEVSTSSKSVITVVDGHVPQARTYLLLRKLLGYVPLFKDIELKL